MSASQAIKAIGLPSLQYVADNSDTKRNTLHKWYKDKPRRFNALIHGVKYIKESEK
jgi:hypothetical protein